MTRRRLLDAAGAVFGERGFRAASLTDVADRAGFTIGAVYSNFAGKDELFHALMEERLRQLEENLASTFPDDEPATDAHAATTDERITAELDRLEAAEDAVPPGWWRLLAEFRSYAATEPARAAELAAADGRCRDILARRIGRFAAGVGLDLPLSAAQLAELSMAAADGLRAAYDAGRSTVRPGAGLRQIVASILATSTRVRPS